LGYVFILLHGSHVGQGFTWYEPEFHIAIAATVNIICNENMQRIHKTSNGFSIAKKSATTNLHLIFTVADFVAKLF
jgi:hypothetical protein